MARVFIGTLMFWAAVYLRNNPKYAGEKWYEIKIGNKTIDMRPFGPLIPTYLFLAELMKDPDKITLRDAMEGVLGINRIAGTTSFLVSQLQTKIDNVQDFEKFKEKAKRFAGEFLGGFSVPFRTFKDLVAHFSEPDAIVRYTKQLPLTGKLLENIPFVSRKLPPSPLITRGDVRKREMPLIRQLTGLIFVPQKNFLESELDRLKIRVSELYPRTGHHEVDRLITQKTGELMEIASQVLERSPKYQKLDDFEKEKILRKLFS